MNIYLIEGKRYSEDDPALQGALARVHHTEKRPLCMCAPSGVPMYVARVDGHYHIKRMPESGSRHSAECGSYEPPAVLSGLGEVMGNAIREDVDDGVTTLKLDFALSKGAGRQPPPPSSGEHESIKADASKLSIRALLHFLWDSAHLTHWSPGMQGRRSWATVYKYLKQAVQHKVTKGMQLSSALYVPEPFYVEKKAEIAQRRSALFSASNRGKQAGQKLFIAVGEIKEVAPARFGHKLVLKHAADFPFLISEDLNKKLKVFRHELDLWNAYSETAHLILVATFSVSTTGVAIIEEMAIMVTNEQWIPFANTNEKDLIDTLIADSRRFVKGQRYNLPGSRPLASVVVTDTLPRDTAIYIIPRNAGEAYQSALTELKESRDFDHLEWEQDGLMPQIPRPGAQEQYETPSEESALANEPPPPDEYPPEWFSERQDA